MRSSGFRLLLLTWLVASAALAGTVSFQTAPGATTTYNGTTLPVSAGADFTLGTTGLSLTLFDYSIDPTSVQQNVSDIYFRVFTASGPYTGPVSIAGLQGTAVTVSNSGAFTLLPLWSVPADSWTIAFESGTANTYHLNALGTGTPNYTVIGGASDQYHQGSFGTSSHNPFLASGVTFFLDFGQTITGIDSVTFSFGTAPGITAPGVSRQTPEPAVLGMTGASLILVSLVLRRRARRG